MAKIWSDIDQRHKNESAFLYMRMWDLQIRGIQDQIIIKQDINIDHARTPSKGLLATYPFFNYFDGFQQVKRAKFRNGLGCLVQKSRLVRIPGLAGARYLFKSLMFMFITPVR